MSITRTLTIAAAAVAALSLAACEAGTTSGSESPTGATATSQERSQAPATTAVEPAAAPVETYEAPSQEEIAERAFLMTVSDYQSPSDEASLMVGRATCALLAEGSTPETLGYEVMVATEPIAPGFLNDELPYFYGAAMGSLCPEYGEEFFG